MTRILVLCAMVAAIAIPVAVAGDPAPGGFANAAAYCKALRTSKGVPAFEAQFGTNKNRKNAFGKCVSATAKSKAAKGGKSGDEKSKQSGKDDDDEKSEQSEKSSKDDDEKSEKSGKSGKGDDDDDKVDEDDKAKDAAMSKAKLACTKLKAADPAKFAQQYKNLGKCKKALRVRS